MNLKRLIHSDIGRIIISILLGLGLATLFRKVCNDRSCMIFKAPQLNSKSAEKFTFGKDKITYYTK